MPPGVIERDPSNADGWSELWYIYVPNDAWNPPLKDTGNDSTRTTPYALVSGHSRSLTASSRS